MNDPKRIKDMGRITAKIKFEDMQSPIQLHTLVDSNVLKRVPREIVEESLKTEINKISLKPGTELYTSYVSFSYSQALKDFDFGNILVEANLPYCLHFPNHSETVVNIAEKNIKALITFQKVWTNRAKTEEGGSDRLDLYVDDIPIYFKQSTILGPILPFKPEDGWESYITGRNIEKVKDQNGIFRYSKLYIQLNMDIPKNIDVITEKSRDRLLKEIQEKCLALVNRLIDDYRTVTDEAHVRRLSNLKVNLIYFIEQNLGFYVAHYNVRTAMINRSKRELKEFNLLLSSGKKPELYKLLLLNAKDSYFTKDYTLAIVESFQALEIFIENYLFSGFKARGDTEVQIKLRLEKNWKTKERLNILLKDLKGIALNEKSNIWDPWCNRYDKTRNEVIHVGQEPTEIETSETLAINEKLINWILTL